MYGGVSLDEFRAMVKVAIDAGVNLFDTADVYGNGLSERVLGELLRGYGDVYVSTKVGYNIYGSGPRQRFDPDYIVFAARRSYERLGRRISLLQIHNPPLGVVRSRGVYEVARKLVEEGIVEHVGVALGPETNVLNEGLASIEMGYESIMFVFNALEQEPARTLIRAGSTRGIGLMARVPHATGALSDRFTPTFPSSDHRSLRNTGWLLRARGIVERYIAPIARGLGLTLGQFALKYVLSYPISTVLLTATSVGELEEYLGAVDGRYLDENTMGTLERLYDEVIVGELPAP